MSGVGRVTAQLLLSLEQQHRRVLVIYNAVFSHSEHRIYLSFLRPRVLCANCIASAFERCI
jgi:hypothetical protein